MLAQGSSLQNQGDVLITAGGKLDMQATKVTRAERSILIQTGSDQLLSELRAVNVSLDAVGSILDNNSTDVNVVATNLRMVAGGTIGEANTLVLPANANTKAIDTQVTTIAAQSKDGIYIEELSAGGDLRVDHVNAVTVDLSVNQVNFRSDTTLQPFSKTNAALDDLTTTVAGPIKVVVDAGTLTITDGTDADGLGVDAAATGDVLLEARGNTSDIVLAVQGGVTSDAGHITFVAQDDILANAFISTASTGTIYLKALDLTGVVGSNNIELTAPVSNVSGDILIDATGSLRIGATVTSQNGNIGLRASGPSGKSDILIDANVTAGGDILMLVDRNMTMKSGVIAKSGTDIVIDSGLTQTLGQLIAVNVALNAGESILDGNGALANVTATNLQMRAVNFIGGVGGNIFSSLNPEAIDTEVTNLAAFANDGIYVQEKAGGLVVDHIDAITSTLSIKQANFNSTTTDQPLAKTVAELNDLTTTAGSIKVVVDNGSLDINPGNDGNGFGVRATQSGDILLQADGAGSDVNIHTNAAVSTPNGQINLAAKDSVTTDAAVRVTNTGNILVTANTGDIVINAQLSTAGGSALLQAAQDITVNSKVLATQDVGVDAGSNITMTAGTEIRADRDVLLINQDGFTMAGDALVAAGKDIVSISDAGDQTLGLLQAKNNVYIEAKNGSVLDGNVNG